MLLFQYPRFTLRTRVPARSTRGWILAIVQSHSIFNLLVPKGDNLLAYSYIEPYVVVKKVQEIINQEPPDERLALDMRTTKVQEKKVQIVIAGRTNSI